MVSASKVLKRRNFLVECGISTQDMFRRIIADKDKIVDAVTFVESSEKLDDCINEYFRRVGAYKIRHKISEPNEINQSKRIALMALTLVDLWPEGVFVFSDEVAFSDAYAPLVFSRFICRTFMTGLFIDEKKIPVTLERDVWNCFRNRRQISEEWMVNFARTYCLCFGESEDPEDIVA